jgi:hypothetical protein
MWIVSVCDRCQKKVWNPKTTMMKVVSIASEMLLKRPEI